MKSMNDLITRTQALQIIIQREIESLMNLKPSKLIDTEEMIQVQQAIQERKLGGVPEQNVAELWQAWIEKVKKTYELHDEMMKYVPQEIRDLFEVEGIDKPFPEKEGEVT